MVLAHRRQAADWAGRGAQQADDARDHIGVRLQQQREICGKKRGLREAHSWTWVGASQWLWKRSILARGSSDDRRLGVTSFELLAQFVVDSKI